MDLLYVQDFWRVHVRTVLPKRRKTMYRIKLRNHFAFNRETLESTGFLFNLRGVNMKVYFEELLRANFRFGRM